MNTNILQNLLSKSPLSTPVIIQSKASSTTLPQQHLLKLTHIKKFIRTRPIYSSSSNTSSDTDGSNEAPPQPVVPPPITPPNTVEVRFRPRSRRQKQKRSEAAAGNKQSLKVQASSTNGNATATKKWEDMSLTEKAIELYVGEKGMLFWLNKFAYASIFIMIGAWILFRFVGPALNLYQLDSAPLSPTAIFKGS